MKRTRSWDRKRSQFETPAVERWEAEQRAKKEAERQAVEDRIAQIRARMAAATPGPWHHVDDHHGHQVHAERLGIPRATVHRGVDADFIAAARDDIPFLLALVDELRRAR